MAAATDLRVALGELGLAFRDEDVADFSALRQEERLFTQTLVSFPASIDLQLVRLWSRACLLRFYSTS